MAALSLRLSAQHVDRPRAAVVTPLREELAGDTRTALIVLLAASAAVLLIVARQLAELSQNTELLGGFALLALLLASLGLYGVLSYAVTQRTNEIGVRRALGATSRDILLAFGRRGLTLTLAGLGIGLAVSVVAARSMTALFYGFRPDYLSSLAAVSVILLTAAALACLVPARRASRVDPMTAL